MVTNVVGMFNMFIKQESQNFCRIKSTIRRVRSVDLIPNKIHGIVLILYDRNKAAFPAKLQPKPFDWQCRGLYTYIM